MNLINRYVYAVIRYLPEGIQEEVSLELRAHIEDMLSDEPTEEEIKEVLKNLGNPQDLAEEYQPNKRYLIGPKYYDQYLKTLKCIMAIVVVNLLIVNAFDWVSTELTAFQLFLSLIGVPIQGIIQSSFWVTLVFLLLEKYNVPFDENENWSIDNLPEVPEIKTKKISRFDTLVSLIFTIFIFMLLYFSPHLISIHGGEGGRIPVFNLETLETYSLLILIFGVLQSSFYIWQWVSTYWSMKMAVINGLINLAWCSIFLIAIQSQIIFNHEVLRVIQGLDMNVSFMERLILIIFIGICFVDTFIGFRKSINRQ